MNAKIIGFKTVDFTPEGGERINGTNVHLALYSESDANRIGGIARKFWRKPEQMVDIMEAAGLTRLRDAVERPANAEFDEDGKLTSLTILPPATLKDAAAVVAAANAAKPPKGIDDVPFGKKA